MVCVDMNFLPHAWSHHVPHGSCTSPMFFSEFLVEHTSKLHEIVRHNQKRILISEVGLTTAPLVSFKYVTEFWKITHIVAPETIGIFDFIMVLQIPQNTSQIFLM